MNRPTSLRSLVVTVSAVSDLAVLGACGGDDDKDASGDKTSSSSSTPSIAPATGDKAEGEGFSFTVPEGWRDITDEIPGFSPEVAYAAPEPQDGFTTNINVLKEPGFSGRSTEEVVEATAEQLGTMGFQEVQQLDPFTLDDKKIGVISATASQNSVTYRTRQYFVGGDDKGWVVTFSFPASSTPDEQKKLAESVMTTWDWS